MDKITFSNFRCFYEEQSVPLAPLTLLVGENSTGKSSFLGLLRVMWNFVVKRRLISFNDSIFPLGAFHEVVSKSPKREQQTFNVEVSFKVENNYFSSEYIHFNVEFGEFKSAPIPRKVRIYEKTNNTEICLELIQDIINMTISAKGNTYTLDYPNIAKNSLDDELHFNLQRIRLAFDPVGQFAEPRIREIPQAEKDLLINLIRLFNSIPARRFQANQLTPVAPIRSRPERTYEVVGRNRDYEGQYVPEHLAEIFRTDPDSWQILKKELERFGEKSGLFDKIIIELLRKNQPGPFQIQFRKSREENELEPSNIIDVGYGVSQILPILTEVLEAGSSNLFLLQQPEVHLHPRAQAELGSFLCQVAGQNKMLIVETHSDYLLDRVRVDVRDNASDLTCDMVSILFFKRNSSDVEIIPMKLDRNGNFVNAPDEYGEFFMEEKRRVLRL